MADKDPENDSKIMDIASPGKGKIIPTSRPVIAPVVDDKKDDALGSESKGVVKAPSTPRKTIQPISVGGNDENKPAEAAAVASGNEASEAVETPDQPENNVNKTENSSEGSESAAIDAVVQTAGDKKEQAKKAEEQAKHDSEVQSLIDSKKYFVKVDHQATKRSNALVLILLVVLVLAAAAYALIDAGVVGSNIKLPYEFIKNSEAEDSRLTTEQTATTEQGNTADKPVENETGDIAESAGQASPEVRARDDDRKSELKNLQQKLEVYFNDNGSYPAALNDLKVPPTTDELTGPNGDSYTYNAAADGQSYVLSAQLENEQDKDADANGNYILNSVNQ